MMPESDSDLLRQFVEKTSDTAFAELVARHVNLVYSVALRQAGNAHLAEEITQTVFIIFAQKAATLRHEQALTSWLFQTTRLTANNILRGELRRRQREQEAFMQSSLNESEDVWPRIAPLLDAAVENLGETDRRAILLRFYEGHNLRDVGLALGASEDAATKRVNRALEKLRKFFSKRGISLSAAAIGGAVSANSVQAAPVGLAKTVSAIAVAKGAVGSTGSLFATAKAIGTMSFFATLVAPLVAIFHNYIAYRIGLAGSQSKEEIGHVKALFSKVGIITLGLFIPFAAVVLWLFGNQSDSLYLLLTGFVLIYLPTMLVLCITSKQKNRGYYAKVREEEYADTGIFQNPAWEYCSEMNLLGLPLIHIRIGDRFSVLKKPATAWIAVGNHAIGGLFAFGCVAIAPLSIGWISIGLLSLGGFSIAVFALGGIALGVWALFGALSVGWQAFGALAIAWNVADGNFSLAHDFAAGRVAFAAEANNFVTKQVMEPTLFFHCTHFIADHWLWLNLVWIISSFIQWRAARKNLSKKLK
jgi:RNA polymerase sigma factor (sigma-70 family)